MNRLRVVRYAPASSSIPMLTAKSLTGTASKRDRMVPMTPPRTT